jgi:ATP-dependent RNA helicase DDX51/DBP6
MTKKIKKEQSRIAEFRSRYPATTVDGTDEHDAAWEDVDYNGEGGDVPMLDSKEEHEVVPDIDDGKGAAVAVAQAAPEKTTKLLRKKKQDRKKGKGKGDMVNPAEHGDFERPRKRHKLLSSSGDASPGYSHMRSRPANATATAEDSSRSSPVMPSSSSPVSSSPEPEPEPEPPTDPQSLLDHRTPTPASPPPPSPPPYLQRFPLPSRPHAPEKSELASQGLDRALVSAQLVDPLLSTPLSLGDENGDDVTGLSARTLRRLRDLGIVELFAGVCVIMSSLQETDRN